MLTALYLDHQKWQETFGRIADFRRRMKTAFGLPVRVEMHAKGFLPNKNPYRALQIPDARRVSVVEHCCDLIGSLDVRIINVVIVKARIRNQNYDVLDTALTYSVQRIENDLRSVQGPNEKFLMITDSGRVGKMRKTARRPQRFNPIPSKFASGTYRQEIATMIEDPLPKDSKESYFIQLADLVACIVYLHAIGETGTGSYPRWLQEFVSNTTVEDWMQRLKPRFNLQAARGEPYGIKYHP